MQDVAVLEIQLKSIKVFKDLSFVDRFSLTVYQRSELF